MLEELARIAEHIFCFWVLWEVVGQGGIWYARDLLGATCVKDKGEAAGVGRESLEPTSLVWFLGNERGKGGGLATKSLRLQHCPKKAWARSRQSPRQSCPPVDSCFLWTPAPHPNSLEEDWPVTSTDYWSQGQGWGSVTQLCSFSRRSEQCIPMVFTFSK